MDGYKRAARARMYPECDDVDMRQTLKASTVFNRQIETMMKLQKLEEPENKGGFRASEPNPYSSMTPTELHETMFRMSIERWRTRNIQ